MTAGESTRASYTREVEMHPRLAERAKEPRYSIPEAAAFIDRPTSTVRRWALGNNRKRDGVRRFDAPLITIDGYSHSSVPLSFLNLLELRFLGVYRNDAPLQSIREALDYAARDMGVERPLLSVEFKVRGKELFVQFAAETGDKLLMNASAGGQIVAWPATADEFFASVDYDEQERNAFRWWPLGRNEPVVVDTRLNGGRPSTARAGVRTRAIAARRGEGLSIPEVAYDVGAAEDEVRAALLFERVAA